MPLQMVRCPNGHETIRYLPTYEGRWLDPSRVCACGHPMADKGSYGTPLTYFTEKNARYIDNLETTIRSHGQHVQVMKERGVEYATQWHTSSKKMTDGLVPKAPKPHPREKL